MKDCGVTDATSLGEMVGRLRVVTKPQYLDQTIASNVASESHSSKLAEILTLNEQRRSSPVVAADTTGTAVDTDKPFSIDQAWAFATGRDASKPINNASWELGVEGDSATRAIKSVPWEVRGERGSAARSIKSVSWEVGSRAGDTSNTTPVRQRAKSLEGRNGNGSSSSGTSQVGGRGDAAGRKQSVQVGQLHEHIEQLRKLREGLEKKQHQTHQHQHHEHQQRQTQHHQHVVTGVISNDDNDDGGDGGVNIDGSGLGQPITANAGSSSSNKVHINGTRHWDLSGAFFKFRPEFLAMVLNTIFLIDCFYKVSRRVNNLLVFTRIERLKVA